ncbi:MAG: tetratricopeptide repeat protein [Gammaproteobacteria bacterium]
MKKKPRAGSGPTSSNLEKQALALFQSGKYKEAIEHYKKLLQNSDNHEWRQQLAYCYLRRALTFAAKDMFKEALVLWENYRQHAVPPYRHYALYLAWLVQTNNHAKIRSALEQLSAQQLDQDDPAMAALLGLLIISAHPEFQQAVPQDSTFLAHLKLVQSALQAYREGHAAGIDEALKQLPYRSAFRDFRTVLKAALISPVEAQALLAKMPADSVYKPASRLLLACGLKGAALAREILKFNVQQRRLIGKIIGLNKKQLELLEQLSKQQEPLSDKLQFNLAIQYQTLCGPALAQRFCFALLTRYPAGQRDYNKAFGTIDSFETNRLKAFRCETNNNHYDAEYYWKQCLTALPSSETANSLKAALILRRMAGWQEDTSEQSRLLIESLEHDPEDRDCYLQILRCYSQQAKKPKDYQQWLAKTLKKFPADVDVLTLATQTAARQRDYKKACEYASKLLSVDQLNTFAKQALFSNHLAHARQLLRSKHYPAAEHEIQQAEELKIGKINTLQTQLLRGLHSFAAQDKQEGLRAILEALNKLHKDPINAHLQAAMEASLSGLPVATLLKALPPAKNSILAPQDLAHLHRLLEEYGREDGNRELLHKALEKIKAPLKKSLSQQTYDESLLLSLCQTLDTIGHFELLRHCAKLAQAKWLHKPIWMYYRVYSETNGDAGRCSYMQRMRLELNLEQARQEKDLRTATLIGNYLDHYHGVHFPGGKDFLNDLFGGGDEDDFDPFDRLFGHLPDEIYYKLDKKAASVAKKLSPEHLVRDLEQQTGRGTDVFSAIMQNPDIFIALLFLKAADELGIDTGVTTKDVLECFNV